MKRNVEIILYFRGSKKLLPFLILSKNFLFPIVRFEKGRMRKCRKVILSAFVLRDPFDQHIQICVLRSLRLVFMRFQWPSLCIFYA